MRSEEEVRIKLQDMKADYQEAVSRGDYLGVSEGAMIVALEWVLQEEHEE